MSPYALPSANHLDVEALAGLFAKTTASYNFLFFHALLDESPSSTRARWCTNVTTTRGASSAR